MKGFIRGGLFAAFFILICGVVNCGIDLLADVLAGEATQHFWTAHFYAVVFMTTFAFIAGGIVGRILGRKQ